MNIAIIGTGNVGSALAVQWAKAGHTVLPGVRDITRFKGRELLNHAGIVAHPTAEAVAAAEVILLATPPQVVPDLLAPLGDLSGKVVIDATNSFRAKPANHPTVYHFLTGETKAKAVKCFNTTGFENMKNPVYGEDAIDMFMAGDSDEAKAVARQLALDAGFGACWDFGKGEQVALLESLAMAWINLAIIQGHGRQMAFKVLTR